jgi:MYND finger
MEKHGGVDSWASKEQMKNMHIPPWILEQQRTLNKVETDYEVAKHLNEKVPCNCLDDMVPDMRKERIAMAECFCCHKKGNVTKILQCKNCKVVQYCSRECQVKDWPIHKALCKLHQGKTAKLQDLERSIADFQKKHQRP